MHQEIWLIGLNALCIFWCLFGSQGYRCAWVCILIIFQMLFVFWGVFLSRHIFLCMQFSPCCLSFLNGLLSYFFHAHVCLLHFSLQISQELNFHLLTSLCLFPFEWSRPHLLPSVYYGLKEISSEINLPCGPSVFQAETKQKHQKALSEIWSNFNRNGDVSM